MVFDAVARHSTGVLSLQCFRDTLGHAREPLSESESFSQTATILLRCASGERTPTLEEAERILIEQALQNANGNQGAAAATLGISRNALNKKLIREKQRK